MEHNTSSFPFLYQLNTRVFMTDLARDLGREATLDDIGDDYLDKIASQGFDWIWLLSVWQTGIESRQVSCSNQGWRKEFEETLSDLKDEDIPGSGFAITGYTVHKSLGGNDALARLRERMSKRKIKLMLDFVPNHMALDHPWRWSHSDYFVVGTEEDDLRAPQNYIKLKTGEKEIVFAYGRDPYFDGWPDTLQLNYGNPSAWKAMFDEVLTISGQCDGVRCDMAMLILPEVFQRTWGIQCEPFWPQVTKAVKEKNADFKFMAEVYWDLEWTLQQQGFDFTYDKRLYDRLHEGNARSVRDHLCADKDFQNRSVRFLENHDEPRCASAFPLGKHQAAAIITYFTPGLRFFHNGQSTGCKKRISPHLGRAPKEEMEQVLCTFYAQLLDTLKIPTFRNGTWKLLDTRNAWQGNETSDHYIAFAWQGSKNEKYIVVVNYSEHQSQCYLTLPFDGLEGHSWKLVDIFSKITYQRVGTELQSNGLFVDEPGWKFYILELLRDGA